jgi:hypothetical protein
MIWRRRTSVRAGVSSCALTGMVIPDVWTGGAEMVARLPGAVLWAAPRFRRQEWEPHERRSREAGILSEDGHGAAAESLQMTKLIADAAAEAPDGAACLYARH